MVTNYIDKSFKQGITTFRLNRPPVNAIGLNFIKEFLVALDGCESDARVRVLVITSALPDIFSAGADIRELRNRSHAECRKFVEHGQRLCDRLERLPIPVIAAVRGICLGGGCELAMACDFRIAANSARFGSPEVNLGLLAGWGGTQRICRLVGKTRATQLLMLGDHFSASTGLSMGFVNRVVPGGDLVHEATALASKLARKSPVALAAIKRAVQQGLSVPLAEGLKIELKNYLSCYASADTPEGINAFLEKRRPRFADTRPVAHLL